MNRKQKIVLGAAIIVIVVVNKQLSPYWVWMAILTVGLIYTLRDKKQKEESANKVIFIKTRRYSTLIKRIFEEYKDNVEVYIERHRYTEKDMPELANWWCTNRIIKRTIDFTLKRDRVDLFGFHDTPDQFWAAMSEQPFVEGLAKEKIVRYRVYSEKPKRPLHKSLAKFVSGLFLRKDKGEI